MLLEEIILFLIISPQSGQQPLFTLITTCLTARDILPLAPNDFRFSPGPKEAVKEANIHEHERTRKHPGIDQDKQSHLTTPQARGRQSRWRSARQARRAGRGARGEGCRSVNGKAGLHDALPTW